MFRIEYLYSRIPEKGASRTPEHVPTIAIIVRALLHVYRNRLQLEKPLRTNHGVTMKSSLLMLCTVLLSVSACAQKLLTGDSIRLLPTDSAVFERQEPRNDLPCAVTPVRPELGFDFTYHTGFQVTIPMRTLTGAEDTLTILFRVSQKDRGEDPVYLTQEVEVPLIERGTSGDAELHGAFLVGEGKYHVDWLMRNRSGRVCASFWDLDARPGKKDRQVAQWIEPGLILPADGQLFKEDPPVERDRQSQQLRVGIIVNFAPQNPRSNTLNEADLQGPVAILRKISRDPRIREYSLVACSIRAQRIIYRQENGTHIDLPAIGAALSEAKLATVDVNQLTWKNGETRFLADLISEEARKDNLDAVIFVSPRAYLENSMSREVLTTLRDLNRPVFYINYTVDPVPWRDAIGMAMKKLRGLEYTMSRPRDLVNAWSDIVSRLLKAKNTTQSSVASAH